MSSKPRTNATEQTSSRSRTASQTGIPQNCFDVEVSDRGSLNLIFPRGLEHAVARGSRFGGAFVTTNSFEGDAQTGSTTLSIPTGALPDELHDIMREQFGQEVMDELTLAVENRKTHTRLSCDRQRIRYFLDSIQYSFGF